MIPAIPKVQRTAASWCHFALVSPGGRLLYPRRIISDVLQLEVAMVGLALELQEQKNGGNLWNNQLIKADPLR